MGVSSQNHKHLISEGSRSRQENRTICERRGSDFQPWRCAAWILYDWLQGRIARRYGLNQEKERHVAQSNVMLRDGFNERPSISPPKRSEDIDTASEFKLSLS